MNSQVEQVDRDRAADFMFECGPYLGDCGMKSSVELALRQAFARCRLAALSQPPVLDEREVIRSEIINAPETADFMAGVPIEALHQRGRWGADHDAGKSPFDWFWLIGYLAQKAADAAVRGDDEKARHHTISTAAALANWHAALSGANTRMRPGIDPRNLGGPDDVA